MGKFIRLLVNKLLLWATYWGKISKKCFLDIKQELMRKWVVFTVTALLLATQSHAEQPVQCDTEESGFRGILHKVSNVLS